MLGLFFLKIYNLNHTIFLLSPLFSAGRGWCYLLWCTGGLGQNSTTAAETPANGEKGHSGIQGAPDSNNPIPNNKSFDDSKPQITSPFITDFLGHTFAPFLMKAPCKVIVLLLYGLYLGVAVWGCTALKQGLDMRSLAPRWILYDRLLQRLHSVL